MKKRSQRQRLFELLSDLRPHNTSEIQQTVYGGDHKGTARIASRVSEIREEVAAKGYEVACKKVPGEQSLFYYQMVPLSGTVQQPLVKPKPQFELVTMPDGTRVARRVI